MQGHNDVPVLPTLPVTNGSESIISDLRIRAGSMLLSNYDTLTHLNSNKLPSMWGKEGGSCETFLSRSCREWEVGRKSAVPGEHLINIFLLLLPQVEECLEVENNAQLPSLVTTLIHKAQR